MVKRAIGSHHSARPQTTTWLSPPHVIRALGGPTSFDLDPCTIENSPIPTARHGYFLPTNGLAQPWFDRTYLNPPYTSNEIGRWLAKLADHGRGTALIFARTETEAFVSQVWDRASGLLFIAGRLHFHYPDAPDAMAALDPTHSHTWVFRDPVEETGGWCCVCGAAKANAGAPSVLCAYGQDDLDRLAACGLPGAFSALRFARFLVVGALDQSWREAVLDHIRTERGPVVVADLYRALSRHPKTRRNPNWRAKVRQTLQRGPFRRVGPGAWVLEGQAA